MSIASSISRRNFLAASVAGAGAAATLASMARPESVLAASKIPVGLELYSVRGELMKDEIGTVRRVAKMGYQVVEFYAPYYSWTTDHAKEIRKVLDDEGIQCRSTHNNFSNFDAANLPKAIELNRIIGANYIMMASNPSVKGIDGWKSLGEQMTKVSEQLKPLGMATGFHNHNTEWAMVEGRRPMDVLAENTPKEFILQFDVGTCVQAGADPIAWIKAHPGRIKCIHCKDYALATNTAAPDRANRVLFGEGDSPWQAIFDAAESGGGVEYYLIEQEGSRFPEFETVEKCLATWKKMRA